MSTYSKYEDRIDALRASMRELTDKPELEASERDSVMQMQGEIESLSAVVRDLRDKERDDLQTVVDSGSTVADGTKASGVREIEDFRAYLKGTGEIKNASMTTTDGNGGYIVPEPLHAEMADLYYKVSPIMANARVFEIAGGDGTIYLPLKTGHNAVAWAAETAARSEQNAPTFGNISLVARDLYAYPYVSQRLLDSTPDAESLVLDDAVRSIAQEANVRFCTGTGTTQPDGVFANTGGTYPFTIQASATNDVLTHAELITGYYTLPAQYMPNAKWYMKPATLASLAQMSRGATLTTFPLVQFDANGDASILGKPVVLTDDAPAIGNGLYPAFFGDMRQAYAVAMHKETSVLRNPFNPPYVQFYCLTRIGGVPWDPKAGILFKSDT